MPSLTVNATVLWFVGFLANRPDIQFGMAGALAYAGERVFTYDIRPSLGRDQSVI